MEQQPRPRRRLFGIGDLIGVTALVAIIGGLMLFDSWDRGRRVQVSYTPDQIEAPNSAPDGSASPGRWSKSEFDKYVANKTKAQVRDEFGPPDSIDDVDDSWTYWSIPVYDAEAGVKVHTTIIRFAGMEGGSDFAVGARYY